MRVIGNRDLSLNTQTWVSLAVWLLSLLTAWKIGEWLAAGDMNSIIWGGMALVLGAISTAILRDWRAGFYIFIIWLLLEDFIRKYMGNNMLIYFGKDALTAIVYFSFFHAVHQHRAHRFRFPFMICVSVFFWLGVLQCFNPNSPSLLYGLLGFKLYFYYIPLVFVGYELIRAEEDLRRFLVINMALAVPITVLGIIQSIVGPSFLNPSVLAPDIRELSTLYRVDPISGASLYQPNSVFVSTGRFDLYLLLVWLLGLGSAAYLLLRRGRGKTIVFTAVALIAVAALMCGGRGALLYILGSGLVFAAAFLWGAPQQQERRRRLVKAVWRVSAVAGIAVLIAVSIFPAAAGVRLSYYSATILPNSPNEQLTGRVESYPIQEFEKAFAQGGWLLGHGIGLASLGVQYVSRWSGQRPPNIGVESGFGNIMLEYGIVGLFLWWIWTAALLFTAWKEVRKLRHTVYFPIAFAIFWFALLILYPMTYGTLNVYQDFIFNAYLWLLIGILFRLSVLASQAKAA